MYQTPAERKGLPYKQRRTWTYGKEFMVSGACYDCGLYYGGDAWADIAVPDDVWKLINPGIHEGGGLLCFNCMNRRLTFLGLEEVPFQIGSGPFSPPYEEQAKHFKEINSHEEQDDNA